MVRVWVGLFIGTAHVLLRTHGITAVSAGTAIRKTSWKKTAEIPALSGHPLQPVCLHLYTTMPYVFGIFMRPVFNRFTI